MSLLASDAAARLARAKDALEGLSVGDAFGERFFHFTGDEGIRLAHRKLPPSPWRWTDDTEMALSVYAVLRDCGEIREARLALWFGERYDPHRGYGAAMHSLLPAYARGLDWQRGASSLFGGTGSFGNGGAMRAAPVGAYFADDPDAAMEQAARSAAVTHAHPEGIVGAVAVALAAALSAGHAAAGTRPAPGDFLHQVQDRIPGSLVREGVLKAIDVPSGASGQKAAAALGSGQNISAQDTVPFVLWCAAQHLDDYEQALWLTVNGLGDRDTTCAMVGGIVASHVGAEGVPAEWRASREALPSWATDDS